MGDADPGDTHSVDSSGSAALATEENHSSNSEMEHLEQEEAEGPETDEDIQAPQTQELLVSAEEPHIETEPIEFMQVVPPMALPPLPILQLDPPSSIPTPVLSALASKTEEIDSTQGLCPPSVFTPINAPHVGLAPDNLSQTDSVQDSQTAEEKDHTKSKPDKTLSSELPVLLCGSAALVAVLGIVAYGAVAYCRK